MLQRKCACGGTPGPTGECENCRKKRESREQTLQRATIDSDSVSAVPPIVHDVLQSPGQPLDKETRAFFEPRFGHDFSQVRVHTDSKAYESANAVNALAYTVGQHVVFSKNQFAPETLDGRKLLAHELTHTVQQHGSLPVSRNSLAINMSTDAYEHEAERLARAFVNSSEPVSASSAMTHPVTLQRACLPAADCAAPILGSSTEFGVSEEAVEAPARARRSRMSPARARASGHAGSGKQLEKFLESQSPGLLAHIHGIFIDQDMSPGTGALTMDCASFVPPITGATKPCVFVPGTLNQQALAFNTTKALTIGGISREEWRIQTVQILTHEIQHVKFDTAAKAVPAGVSAGCPRATVDFELSELNAIMSEFPIVFRAVPVGAGVADPARIRLNNWFNSSITNPSESISGILKTLRCKCDCGDIDKYVKDTFNFVSASWTAAEKTAFNSELKDAKWAAFKLNWPL